MFGFFEVVSSLPAVAAVALFREADSYSERRHLKQLKPQKCQSGSANAAL